MARHTLRVFLLVLLSLMTTGCLSAPASPTASGAWLAGTVNAPDGRPTRYIVAYRATGHDLPDNGKYFVAIPAGPDGYPVEPFGVFTQAESRELVQTPAAAAVSASQFTPEQLLQAAAMRRSPAFVPRPEANASCIFTSRDGKVHIVAIECDAASAQQGFYGLIRPPSAPRHLLLVPVTVDVPGKDVTRSNLETALLLPITLPIDAVGAVVGVVVWECGLVSLR